MDIAAMSIDNALSSLQSSISMVTMRKAMNQDAMAMDQLIANMQEVTQQMPKPAVGEVGHMLDIRV